jgi:hypothetical protein
MNRVTRKYLFPPVSIKGDASMILFSKLTDSEKTTLEDIAALLGTSPDWLYSLIDFESKWNPAAKNPYSSAIGLIQFTDSTARGLGYKNALDLVRINPSRLEQLKGPVYRYLRLYAPFPTQQSLLMAVFYPKYRNVAPDTLFPESVLAVNRGIKTPADYIKKVFPEWIAPTIGGGVVAVAALFLYLFSQKGA